MVARRAPVDADVNVCRVHEWIYAGQLHIFSTSTRRQFGAAR